MRLTIDGTLLLMKCGPFISTVSVSYLLGRCPVSPGQTGNVSLPQCRPSLSTRGTLLHQMGQSPTKVTISFTLDGGGGSVLKAKAGPRPSAGEAPPKEDYRAPFMSCLLCKVACCSLEVPA